MIETDQITLSELIEEAKESGGPELANYQTFVSDLAPALGLKRPDMAKEETRLNDYVFERRVTFHHPNGTTSNGLLSNYNIQCPFALPCSCGTFARFDNQSLPTTAPRAMAETIG